MKLARGRIVGMLDLMIELRSRAGSMIADLWGLVVNKVLDPDVGDFGLPDRWTTWKSRSFGFKLTHRWNVLCAFASGAISFYSLCIGLRFAYCIVALAPRKPGAGMVYICPAWISHLDEMVVGPMTQQLEFNQL